MTAPAENHCEHKYAAAITRGRASLKHCSAPGETRHAWPPPGSLAGYASAVSRETSSACTAGQRERQGEARVRDRAAGPPTIEAGTPVTEPGKAIHGRSRQSPGACTDPA